MHAEVQQSPLWHLLKQRMDDIEPVFVDALSRYMAGIGNRLNVYFSASHVGPDGVPWLQVVSPMADMQADTLPATETLKTLLSLGFAVAQHHGHFSLGFDSVMNAAVLMWEHPISLSPNDTAQQFDDFLDASEALRNMMESAEAQSFNAPRGGMSSAGMSNFGGFENGQMMNASLLQLLEQSHKKPD